MSEEQKHDLNTAEGRFWNTSEEVTKILTRIFNRPMSVSWNRDKMCDYQFRHPRAICTEEGIDLHGFFFYDERSSGGQQFQYLLPDKAPMWELATVFTYIALYQHKLMEKFPVIINDGWEFERTAHGLGIKHYLKKYKEFFFPVETSYSIFRALATEPVVAIRMDIYNMLKKAGIEIVKPNTDYKPLIESFLKNTTEGKEELLEVDNDK